MGHQRLDQALRIVVGIPTVGRAAVLCETLIELSRQSRRADRIIVCATRTEDVAGVAAVAPAATVLLSAPGLPRQRNAIIAAAADADAVLFFDDDFLPGPDYLAVVERHLLQAPDTVIVTGAVLADGIGGAGLTPQAGRAILARHADSTPDAAVRPVFNGYGCNMAVRLAPVRAHDIRFDERLPLYGWQEDVDFSCRLAAHGAVVRLAAAQGVHLGVKSGRNAGIRLGYSQVANPLYLARRRRGYPWSRALHHICKNMAMNTWRALRPEPYVDRRGRLRGNLIALRDLLAGRMLPERILDL